MARERRLEDLTFEEEVGMLKPVLMKIIPKGMLLEIPVPDRLIVNLNGRMSYDVSDRHVKEAWKELIQDRTARKRAKDSRYYSSYLTPHPL